MYLPVLSNTARNKVNDPREKFLLRRIWLVIYGQYENKELPEECFVKEAKLEAMLINRINWKVEKSNDVKSLKIFLPLIQYIHDKFQDIDCELLYIYV